MNEIAVGELGGILPELLLLVGGLLVLLLDMTQAGKRDSGRSFMAVAVLFLVVALVGVVLQIDIAPRTVLYVIEIDPFATFLKITIYTGMILVAVGGGAYMNQHATGRGEFWTLFMFVTLAMSVAVSATNLLVLFLAIEFLSITSYILAGFLREDRRSSEAGVKYFIYGSVAAAIMLYGMSLLYGAGGSLDLRTLGAAFAERQNLSPVILPASIMVLVGLGFKASLAPFHQWAPDTYDGAPTPITAYLTTASKAVGFAVMARLLIVALGPYQVDWVPILAGLSILTMTVGNLVALRQSSVKRMLAYSSVAQAGYLLMGLTAIVSGGATDVSLLGMNGLNGLLIYLFAYLFTNIGAFMVVLAVEQATGTHHISSYSNLVQRAPWLAWAMLIFMLSLTGIPLTGGFVGKFYVFGATIQHQYFWLAAIAVVNVAIGAYYYLGVVRAMFFVNTETDAAEEDKSATGESGGAHAAGARAAVKQVAVERMPVPIGVQFILVICVTATIWLGFYPGNILDWANDASRQLLAMMLQVG